MTDPVILSSTRNGKTVKAAVIGIHRSLLAEFGGAIIWGKSVRHSPQKVGLDHILEDEDVMQIIKKKANAKQIEGKKTGKLERPFKAAKTAAAKSTKLV